MVENIIEIKVFSQEMYLFANKLTIQLTEGQKTLSVESFCAILESPNTHLFMIYDADGIPTGMLTVAVYHTATGSKAWIEDVTVDENFRGRGYGKKIVEHAIEFIRNSGVDALSLTSNASRVAANELYQKSGFELYPTNVYRMKLSK